jgi:hypothetical protein
MNPTNQPPTSVTTDLKTVVTDVLGDLAFMVTDDEAPDLRAGAVWMQARITYFGPASGTLSCWCTRDLATQLAANLLGIEPEEGQALTAADDALREFMNVLCGQLVTSWHGTEAVFNLSIPDVSECDETPQMDPAAEASCQISIDGEPLYCTYHKNQTSGQ